MSAIEICLCTDDLTLLHDNVTKVYRAGVERIELCSAMTDEGLTPSYEAVNLARQAFGHRSGLIVMIRPRAGNFIYNSTEAELMKDQIVQMAKCGVDGVVFGALDADGSSLDLSLIKKLVLLSQSLGLQVGIHRAFDAIDDYQLAIKQLSQLSVDRILTSGSAWGSKNNALAGITRLKELALSVNNNFEIVVAGGVSSDNAQTLVEQLSVVTNKFSLHAYSSVLIENCIDSKAVKALINKTILV